MPVFHSQLILMEVFGLFDYMRSTADINALLFVDISLTLVVL